MTSLQRSEEIWSFPEKQWLSVTRDRCSGITPRATLLFCHGLTGDKIGPQKLLSDLSAHLAISCGVEVVRFDFRGSGLSSGSFSETSLDSMCEDALWISKHLDAPLIWIGISTGALVALMTAAKRLQNENVIAISNGFSESVTFNNTEENLVPIRGGQLFLSNDYFYKRTLLHPRQDFFPKVGIITVVLGSNDEKHYPEYQSLQNSGINVHTLEGGDHLFTKSEIRKKLFTFLEELIYETM